VRFHPLGNAKFLLEHAGPSIKHQAQITEGLKNDRAGSHAPLKSGCDDPITHKEKEVVLD
jgi:hypothetical protein